MLGERERGREGGEEGGREGGGGEEGGRREVVLYRCCFNVCTACVRHTESVFSSNPWLMSR